MESIQLEESRVGKSCISSLYPVQDNSKLLSTAAGKESYGRENARRA